MGSSGVHPHPDEPVGVAEAIRRAWPEHPSAVPAKTVESDLRSSLEVVPLDPLGVKAPRVGKRAAPKT
jgi:hypothetical protein